ncbi:TMEM175 family protein [Listeria marthii]|nr:TMEM175 family protein [Listeria marthii]UHP13489.1 TMEM175 family protein [Listeria marthii]
MSKGRLEAFSDGVFAIIITIIVLGMTLPDTFTPASTQTFLWEIFIFIEAGLLIGQFWYSHSRLFDQVTSISTSAVLFNILFLLILSLVPLFTRAIMQHPDMTAPIIGFVITILITSLIFQLLHRAVNGKNSGIDNWIFRISSFIFVIIIGTISFSAPQISTILFIIFPVAGWIMQLVYRRQTKK